MTWTNPTTWTAGDTVTATGLNEQVRDNLLHIAGTGGFTAALSATRGVEPAAGYFAGAARQNYHLEGGSYTVDGAGVTVIFTNAYASTPAVVVVSEYGSSQAEIYVVSIGYSDFVVKTTGTTSTGRWLAWGSDT